MMDKFDSITELTAVKALDGRIFATLSPEEEAVLEFYRRQGRKYGVAITFINEAGSATFAADAILRKSNSRVVVNIGLA